MAPELVSICIPVYNGAAYLEAAIESALAQTHPATEVLIIDDQSSDASPAIARAWGERSPRVRLAANPRNLGLVGNWNRCIELARGTWIKFLFQDDLLAPECVAKLWARGREGWPFVACERDFLFEGTADPALVAYFEAHHRSVRDAFGDSHGLPAQAYADRAAPALHLNWVGEPTVTLIQASLVRRLGSFNPALAQMCDVEFWHRAGSHAGVGFVPEALATFRVHAGATTARNQGDRFFASDSLDKLALAHLMARSPAYAPLRESLRRLPGLPDAEATFRKRAHGVHEWVRQHGHEPCGNSSVEAVYAQFLARLPGCAVSPLAHGLWRARSRLRQGLHRGAE